MQASVDQASALLDQGKPLQSAAVCGAILAREPRNAIAAHLLGLALQETGDLPQAEEWFRFSIRLEPNRGEFRANFGNFLRKQRKYTRAERNYLRALELLPAHRPARAGLALTLTELERFGEAEKQCRTLLGSDASDADVWVILALALTGQERLPEAEAAYRRAIVLDPQHKVAHHNLGALLARLERPEALQSLETAVRLGAEGFESAYNRGHALLSAGDLEGAEGAFERAVQLEPTQAEAQLNLARIRYQRGDPKFARALATALAGRPDDVSLQLLFGEVLWRAGNHTAAETVARDLLARQEPPPAARSMLAAILLEAGNRLEEAEAQALEAAAALPEDTAVIQNLVSILLARGRAEDAEAFIAAQRRKHPQALYWLAYEATAARVLGRDRYHELFDYERLVRVFELEPPPGYASMAELNEGVRVALSDRHRFSNHPLDQSLRNGTQTSRSLLVDPDPAIQALLKAFEAPIAEYRSALGVDAGHPLSAANVGVSRFTGAWSVCLRRDGFHVNHFHPDGLISSAYYVDVPAETRDPALKSGWLKFGEPRYAVPGVTAERFVQPLPGRLVLFPSYMWHGTNAIRGDQPRTCIAFDTRPGPA